MESTPNILEWPQSKELWKHKTVSVQKNPYVNSMNKYLEKVKEFESFDASDDLLIRVIFDQYKYFDREFTKIIKEIKSKTNEVYNWDEKKRARKLFYYGKEYCTYQTQYEIESIKFSDDDISNVCKDCLERLEKYDSAKIIESIKKKIDDVNNEVKPNISDEWIAHYNKKRSCKKYSVASIVLNQDLFIKSNYNENILTDFIRDTYEDLENYRHLCIVIDGDIFNEKDEAITWNLMYKAGIFAENFISFEDKFFPFKKEKKIEQLSSFLKERNIKQSENIAERFYSSISTGYKFEDCYVSDNQQYKIMIYKKIELDDSNVPCPACGTIDQRGNSYPELFLKSWECSFPSCPERSKSGRGKRFDEYGCYRYFKMVENNPKDRIDIDFYKNWRRDVFDHSLSYVDLIIREYSWSGEKVLIYNCDQITETYGRTILNKYDSKKTIKKCSNAYGDLPIVKLFNSINHVIKTNDGKRIIQKNIEVINGNSTDTLVDLEPNQIGTAMTSPPYYNAREYSQWPTLLLYLIDMMINAKAVYYAMSKDGHYLYNIGDIVNTDNIYVESHMSNRREALGFLSCMVFEIAGFNLVGNMIWDKGEVQSKRNSTENLISGYVKCVNCYEHVLLFKKGNYSELHNEVYQITPVIKINSKGENTYKHTAPYPIELVEKIKPFIYPDKYVLDPYLGSGTTIRWCSINGVKGVGIEMNREYYKLSVQNIFSHL